MAKYPGLQPHYGDADGFGRYYTGSSKAKQMHRKKHNFLDLISLTIRAKKKNRNSKY